MILTARQWISADLRRRAKNPNEHKPTILLIPVYSISLRLPTKGYFSVFDLPPGFRTFGTACSETSERKVKIMRRKIKKLSNQSGSTQNSYVSFRVLRSQVVLASS
jgi:hypothetical protein